MNRRTRSDLVWFAALAVLVAASCRQKPESTAEDTPRESSAVKTEVSAPTPTVAGHALKANWPLGSKLTYRMDLRHTMGIPLPGSNETMEQGTTLSQTYSLKVVQELPDGGRELEMEFTAMEMESRMGDQVMMSFDSKGDVESDRNNPIAGPLRQVIGSKERVQLNASNEVASTAGTDSFLQKLTRGAAAQVQKLIQSSLSEDDFHRIFEFYKVLPSNPVASGSSWPVSLNTAVIPVGTLPSNAIAAFAGLEEKNGRECAKLEFSGPLNPEAKPGVGLLGAMTLEKGTLSGATWFDPRSGTLTESTNRSVLTAKMELPRALGGGGVSMTIQQDVQVRLVEVEPASP